MRVEISIGFRIMAMSLWKLWSAVLVSSRDWNARLLMRIIQFLVEVASNEIEWHDWWVPVNQRCCSTSLCFALYYVNAQKQVLSNTGSINGRRRKRTGRR